MSETGLAGVETALVAAGTKRRFRAGAPLFHEGDPSDHVALLLKGRVKIMASAGEGDAVLAFRGPGELVGELSAIDGQPRSATAVAVETVEAVVVSADAFRQALTNEPGAALAVLVSVVARLRDADRRRVEFGSRPSLARVASRLVELASTYGRAGAGGDVRIDLPVTQEELAGWAGASRESVARALATLRATGVVSTARRLITVHDLDRLRAMAR